MPKGRKEIWQFLAKVHEKARTKKKELTEEDLRTYFVKTGTLEYLGYSKIGEDIRLERTIYKRGKRPDIQCLDEYGNVVLVVEFKRPSDETNLKDHLPQLWDRYVVPLKAKYGLITNGLSIVLYERVGLNPHIILERNLADITETDCEIILTRLQKPSYEMTDVKKVLQYFRRFSNSDEMRPLDTGLARELFFEDFALKEGSLFSMLVQATIQLFDFQYEKSKFLTSAYDFWLKSYARKPDRVPQSWRKLLRNSGLSDSPKDLYKFMFCLETTYALFTRLILAKACEDYGFPHIDFKEFLGRIKGFRGEIALVSWGILMTQWIENLRDSLVESVFEEDIFYWWTDKFSDMRNWELWKLFSPTHVENELLPFGKCVSKVMFTLYKYDFSKIAGDPLGDLYQKYFDKETRKALGEFYTPKEVVSYILNAVGYGGPFITDKRLLDPACGSGTFLVDALKRYLDASKSRAKEIGWGEVLKNLCNEFRIVGFDIHPFATIMSQIHFMLVLIPYYRKAIETDRTFVLRRIPIFRTDSLMDERKGEQAGIMAFVEGIRNVQLRIRLPIKKRIEDKEFVEIEVVMPRTHEVWSNTDLKNVPEYFCALQAIFDVVKHQARNEEYEIDRDLMKRRLKEYLEDKNWNRLIGFFGPYAGRIMDNIRNLKYKFGDGRLVKSIEDVMLAGLLKNYVEYDYLVGNPPYINIKNIKTNKEYYKESFETAYEMFDLYVLFFERGIDWLSEEGNMGLITPSKFLSLKYGHKLREFILSKVRIKEIVDVSYVKVFADSTPYPVISILQSESKETERMENRIHIGEIWEDDTGLLGRLTSAKGTEIAGIGTRTIAQKRFHDNPQNIFDINLSDEFHQKFESLGEECKRLGEICGISVGIQTKASVTGASKEDIVFAESELADLSDEERESVKPKLDGKNIRSFRINWDREYVMYDPKKLYNAPPKEILDGKKVLVKDIGTTLMAAYDDTGYYCFDTIYMVHSKKDVSLKYLTGLLNSKFIDYYFKARFSPAHVGSGYQRYRKPFLAELPVKLPQSDKDRELVERIVRKVNRILLQVKVEQRVEGFPTSYLEDREGIELDVITHVFKSNIKSLMPKVTKLVDGGYRVELGKKERSIRAETEAKSRYLSFAFKDNSGRKGLRTKIPIPREESEVKTVLLEYEADNKQLQKMPIPELESQIDELVYDLYGIGKKDRKSIEDHMTRF